MISAPGDALVPQPRITIDRHLRLDASPEQVWPWLVQLGKQRAGWYLPRSVESVMPVRRRAAREILPQFQGLSLGQDIPDWGPGRPVFRVASLVPNRELIYLSLRDRADEWRWPASGAVGPGVLALSWALLLDGDATGTSLHIRLRISPSGSRSVGLIRTVGGFFDWLTIVGLRRGLAERLR